MTKPKLLITGGGYSEIPLIEAAKAMGFFVITTGYLYCLTISISEGSPFQNIINLITT